MSFFKKKDKKGAAPGSVAGTPEKQKTAAPISTAQQVPAVNTTSANASINSLPPTDQPRSRQSEDPQGVSRTV